VRENAGFSLKVVLLTNVHGLPSSSQSTLPFIQYFVLFYDLVRVFHPNTFGFLPFPSYYFSLPLPLFAAFSVESEFSSSSHLLWFWARNNGCKFVTNGNKICTRTFLVCGFHAGIQRTWTFLQLYACYKSNGPVTDYIN
jgi:hypothetical protein